MIEDEEILNLFVDPQSQGKAFELLISKYEKKVYWLIRRMIIDHDDATDLTQETFVKIWHNLDGFKKESKLYTWMYRIASNEALSFLRKKRRYTFIPFNDVEAELEKKINNNLAPEASELDAYFQKAVLKLPEKQRLVFQLRYYDELPYQDIAVITGTSEGALKASYHIAVKKVEAMLKASLNH